MDRRYFLNRAARGGLVAVLFALGGILVSRRQVVLGEACSDDFQCRSCNKLKRCDLPEAENTRNYGQKG